MDNISGLGELLGPILNSPDAMEKLRGAAQELGLGDMLPPPGSTSEAKAASPPAPPPPPKTSPGDIFSPDIMSVLGTVAPLLSKLNEEDDSTRLLEALRPFLSSTRRKRIEEAERMLRIARLLPLVGSLGQTNKDGG